MSVKVIFFLLLEKYKNNRSYRLITIDYESEIILFLLEKNSFKSLLFFVCFTHLKSQYGSVTITKIFLKQNPPTHPNLFHPTNIIIKLPIICLAFGVCLGQAVCVSSSLTFIDGDGQSSNLTPPPPSQTSNNRCVYPIGPCCCCLLVRFIHKNLFRFFLNEIFFYE